MRILVTGATGFAGHFVRRELEEAGHVLVLHGHEHGDIRDPALVDSLVADAKPDACLHMAGIAFVPVGWKDPSLTFGVNVQGTLNLLEALRRQAPGARTLVVSSAQVYGNAPRERPVAEDDALRPDNLYGVTKVAADLASLLYATRYGLAVMTARPCNHIGPGQSADFVVPSFAAQLKAIAAGRREPRMRVGNLESRREFADVRDVARAYRMILERGRGGHAYNIATGRFVRIRELLDMLCRTAGVQPAIEVDPALHRPTDAQPALDTRRIGSEVGWSPQFTLEQTLGDVYAATA